MQNITNKFFQIFFYFTCLFILKVDTFHSRSIAAEDSGVEINFGDIYGIQTNVDNINDRTLTYLKGIIGKLKEGRALEYKMGKQIFIRNFYYDDYCEDIGEYEIIGSVAYPTWCNEGRGPFNLVRNPQSAFLIPLTAELKKGFKYDLNELPNSLDANYMGVISRHNHNPADLMGPNFKYKQEQLLGLVNEAKTRMMLWSISDIVNHYGQENEKNSRRNKANNSYDLAIDLFNRNGERVGGVSFGEHRKHCGNHKKCFLKNIHLLEYQYKTHTPKVISTKEWGYITGKSFPLHTLIEDYGSFKKIFFSRNYYLIIDLGLDELKQLSLSKVDHRIVLNE